MTLRRICVVVFALVVTASATCKLSQIACEHRPAKQVSCPPGHVIDVIDGFYGRKDHSTCSFHLTSNCEAAGSLEKIANDCQDRNSCTLHASNSKFGDPCWGVPKYIKLEYECVPEERYTTKSALACEHRADVTVTCGEDEVILVLDGFYGRDEAESCPGNALSTECFAQGSLEILRSNCNNRRSCVLQASNSVFGDPCVYTNKFIKMEYYCVKKGGDSEPRKALACEHRSNVKVSCPASQAILVQDGFYGRDEAESCPGNALSTDCVAETSRDILQCKCNNRPSCVLVASNSVFGDPCVYTNKFIKMEYFCVPQLLRAVACEHRPAVTVDCPGDKRIKVIDGFYGRDERSTCPGNVFSTDCAAAGSLAVLKQTCDGFASCSIHASNSVFGDPCVYTNKFIKMSYYCYDV